MTVFRRLYERLIFENTLWVLFLVALTAVWMGSHIDEFQMDASAESLVLEDDRDFFPNYIAVPLRLIRFPRK